MLKLKRVGFLFKKAGTPYADVCTKTYFGSFVSFYYLH